MNFQLVLMDNNCYIHLKKNKYVYALLQFCSVYLQGSQAAVKNLNSKVGKLDTDSLKQQEIIYNQDFAIQQLERRINRLKGERSNEEKVALEQKIKEFTEDLEQKQNTHTLLTLQLKRLQVRKYAFR